MEGKPASKTKIVIGIIVGLLTAIVIILLLTKGCQSDKEYTVTFDSNGGSSVKSVKVKENEKVNKPSDPVRDDYIFDGWEYNNDIFDFDTKITKNITLKARWNPIDDSIVLDSTSMSLTIDEEKNIEIEDLPDGVDINDLLWSSSDDSIVTVDSNGKIKALKEGNVTITVKTKDGKYTSKCTVTVTKEDIQVDSISINGLASLTVGSSIKLTISFIPDNATNKNIKWESSNTNIATVDENGVVVGKKTGTVTITATTENGKKATKKITVNQKTTSQNNNNSKNNGNNSSNNKPSTISVTGVSINGGNRTMTQGDRLQLSANVQPSNATNKNVTWSSSNSNVVTVDSNGNIYANQPGTAVITVRTADGGKTATITITVNEKESTYVLYLTGVVMEGTGGITEYEFSVTKDGVAFDGYTSFTYNNHTVYRTDGHMRATYVNNSNKTAEINLPDGTTKKATVIIK